MKIETDESGSQVTIRLAFLLPADTFVSSMIMIGKIVGVH